MELQKIQNALLDGLLSFPITDLDTAGSFNSSGFESRLNWFLSKPISAIFVAGGTGEFFSLSQSEYEQIIQLAGDVVQEQKPLISSVGRSIPEAIQFAKLAERAGVHALLLMPPYLTGCPPDGTIRYAKTIMQQTDLPVIYYNRANGILQAEHLEVLANDCPNFIGLKDGTGNMQDLNDIIKSLGDRLIYIGGVPTAEIISEAYLAIGVNTYSSAVFNFVPDLAIQYYQALRTGNQAITGQILQEFFIPFVRLRSKKKGYAVSLIKAGAQLIGRSGGDVRAPLIMPTVAETEQLESLIEIAQTLTTQK